MYGVLHVDNIAHIVSLVPLKKLDNVPVFVEPLDPYKLCGVRVFDSSGFRMVLCGCAISPPWTRASTPVRAARWTGFFASCGGR